MQAPSCESLVALPASDRVAQQLTVDIVKPSISHDTLKQDPRNQTRPQYNPGLIHKHASMKRSGSGLHGGVVPRGNAAAWALTHDGCAIRMRQEEHEYLQHHHKSHCTVEGTGMILNHGAQTQA